MFWQKNTNKKKVVVALSGGIDSAVSAYLLKKTGYEVIGITLKLISKKNICYNEQNIIDAEKICLDLKIPFKVFDLTYEFEKEVINKFCFEYINGFTPNPCILCNKKIKFGVLLEKTLELNADYLATGHYIKKEYDNSKQIYILKKGIDDIKDQSYFLYFFSQIQLEKLLFPLGNFKKTEIKEIAENINFDFSNKKESYDICFVEKGKYPDFIIEHTKQKIKKGDSLDKSGNRIGKHNGLLYYTIGQKKYLDLEDKKKCVINIDDKNNTITVGEEEDCYKTTFFVKNVNWIEEVSLEINETKTIEVKLRKFHEQSKATIKRIDNEKYQIDFFEKQSAITKGQDAVFYKNNIVLGGGIIFEIS